MGTQAVGKQNPNTHPELLKLAVKRDQSVPMFQPAAMHLDCPCGTAIPLPEAFTGPDAICLGCGAVYGSNGWKR